MDLLLETTNPIDGGTAITNQGLFFTTPVVDILISSQEQTILNEITRRTHAKGEKRDAGEFIRVLLNQTASLKVFRLGVKMKRAISLATCVRVR
jgi:hypothetical protein